MSETTHDRAVRAGFMRTPRPDFRRCKVCGGHVRRRTNIAAPFGYEDTSYPFLHLYVEDWQDNPHDVVLSELCPLGAQFIDGEYVSTYCTLEARHDGPCVYDDTPTASAPIRTLTVSSTAVERCLIRSLDPAHYYPSTGQCVCFCSVARDRGNGLEACTLLDGHDGLCSYGDPS